MNNCMAFRRAKLGAPRESSAVALAHLAQCPECANFSRELDEMDRALEEAARVPVPEGLADRVLLRHQLRGRPRRNWLALAATLLLSAVAALLYMQESEQQALAQRMIAHVLSEPEVLAKTQQVSEAHVARAVASIGGSLRGSFGRVTFLDQCKGLDPGGTHLVIETPNGPVAVLLLPNARRWRNANIEGQGLVASVAAAERGVVSVVARSAADAERIRIQLFQAVRWTS